MRKNFTEIVCLLDCSGSMQGLKADTIGGYNALLEKQQQAEGEACISTVLFNSATRILHDRVDIREVEPLTAKDYTPGGGTALVDAIGGAIHHIGNVHKYARPMDVPEHTLFVITTDGMENASRLYSAEKVRHMIQRQQERYGWEFLFIGANMDAVQTAQSYGIRPERAANYRPDSQGTRLQYEALSRAMTDARNSRPLTEEWKAHVEADYILRSRK